MDLYGVRFMMYSSLNVHTLLKLYIFKELQVIILSKTIDSLYEYALILFGIFDQMILVPLTLVCFVYFAIQKLFIKFGNNC